MYIYTYTHTHSHTHTHRYTHTHTHTHIVFRKQNCCIACSDLFIACSDLFIAKKKIDHESNVLFKKKLFLKNKN